jgi:hypothetical protein
MANELQSPADETRREALKKLGAYAAYTAPTVMVMLTSEKAMAKSGRGGGHKEDKRPKDWEHSHWVPQRWKPRGRHGGGHGPGKSGSKGKHAHSFGKFSYWGH